MKTIAAAAFLLLAATCLSADAAPSSRFESVSAPVAGGAEITPVLPPSSGLKAIEAPTKTMSTPESTQSLPQPEVSAFEPPLAASPAAAPERPAVRVILPSPYAPGR